MLGRVVLLVVLSMFSIASSQGCDENRFNELSKISVKSMSDEEYQEYSSLREACLSLSKTMDRSENSAYTYELKVQKFKGIRIGGLVLLGGGVAVIAVGAAMIASAGTASYEVSQSNGERSESGDPVGGFGGVLASLGIPMTAGGTVLTIVGSRKVREYRGKLEKERSTVQLEIGLQKISIVWAF